MEKYNNSIKALHEESHILYDSYIKAVRKNVMLFVKRETNKVISNNGIAKILANIEQIQLGASGAGWEADVDSKTSTYKSRFAQFNKKLMDKSFYFKVADINRLENMVHLICKICKEEDLLNQLKNERKLEISIMPNFQQDLELVVKRMEAFRLKLSPEILDENLKEEDEMTKEHDGWQEIKFWESSEIFKEVIYSLPSNLSYEMDWSKLKCYFEGLVLLKGEPLTLVFDALDKNDDFPFLMQYGLIIICKPSTNGTKLIVFEFENLPDAEIGKITKVTEMNGAEFYDFIEKYFAEHKIYYLSPDEQKQLLTFINQIK